MSMETSIYTWLNIYEAVIIGYLEGREKRSRRKDWKNNFFNVSAACMV